MDANPSQTIDFPTLVAGAIAGEREALDRLVEAIQDDIYGLALRMLGHLEDAADATQEVLLIVLTHLATFQGKSSFRTWVWRITTHHLLQIRRGRREGVGFDELEALLEKGETTSGAEPPEAERALLVREIEIGCTQAMLLALDRELRLAFILAEILELPGEDAASIVGIAPPAFRKRVSRARARLGAFMRKNCGLVEPRNACRCLRQVPVAIEAGLVDPSKPIFACHPQRNRSPEELSQRVREVDELQREVALFRGHPDYATPTALRARIRDLIGSRRYPLLDA